MTAFAQVLEEARVVEGYRVVVVPESWHQGRTAYGGFSSAIALAEAMRIFDPLPPLRSAQIAMMAPLAGEITISAKLMRQGRNATWIAVEISTERGIGLAANFVFMQPVHSTLTIQDEQLPHDLIAKEQARTFENARAPAFLQNHFEVRFALPRSERPLPDVCWWVRPLEHKRLDSTVALLLAADALPPGVMPLVAPQTPVSTMHWQVNLLTAMPKTNDGWWLLRSIGDHALDGGSSQRMTAWNADGVPAMAGLQSIALFG